jgi:autotransporter translocation and assembly factor TamB
VRATIDRSDLGWGSASALATGWVDTSRMSIDYRIAVGNLATAVPGARGALALRGTAAGPLRTPRVRSTVRGRDIVYGTNRLAVLEGRADVDLAPNGRTDVDLAGDRASVGAQAIDRVVLAMRGTQRRHTITGDVQVAQGGIDLAMQGGLPGGVQGRRWAGSLTRLDVSSRRAGDWRLERSAPLRLAPTSASLGRLCLAGMVDARVCAQGAWRGGTTWQAQGTVERFPLARLDSLLPDTLRLAAAPAPAPGDTATLAPDQRDRVRADSILIASHELDGTLEARFDLRSAGGRLLGGAGAELRRAAFLYKREAGDSAFQRVAFDTATFALTARGADGGVRGQLRVRALEGDSAGARQLGTLAGVFQLPSYTRFGLPLERQLVTARVDGRLERLSVVQAFVPRLDSVQGAATLGMTVNGTVGLPRLDGELRLDSIAAWWPGGRAARGAVTATANTVVGPGRRLTATLAVVPRGVLYDYLLDTIPARVAVDSGGLELRVSPGQGLLARMALGLSDPGAQGTAGGTRVASLEATLAMPAYRSLDQALAAVPLSLEARGELPDLGFARILPLPVDSLGGRLRVDLAMEGTLAAPRVTGTARATDFAALLPQGSLVRGHVDGDLRAAVGADSSLTADFRLAPREMLLEWGEGEGRRQVAVDTAALVVTSRPGQGLRGALDLRLANVLRYAPGVAAGTQEGVPVGAVAGRFALPGWRRLSQPVAPQALTASLDGRIDDLAFVEAVAPQLDSLSGVCVSCVYVCLCLCFVFCVCVFCV